MTETTTASSSGSTEWMELQRKYWDAWSQLCQQTLNSNLLSKNTNPWALALDNWWKAISPGMPTQNHSVLEKIVGQSKGFFQISEEFTRFLGSFDPSKSVGNWQELLHSKMDEWKRTLSQPSTEGMRKAMRGLFPFFELPLDTWTRTLSSASPLPGDFLRALKPEGLADELHDRIGRFLSVPGVGYTREWQEQAQRGARLLLDYERALQEYVHIYSKLGVDILERLSKKIFDRAEQGEEIKSLRQLYDLWVDCCEEAYNDFVFTEEYADVYGRLINALMALKHHSQSMVDELMGALNMPTHKGMTTLQSRQQELKRELMEMRSVLSEAPSKADLKGVKAELKALHTDLAKIAAIQQELHAMHKELDALQTSLDAKGVNLLESKDLEEPVTKARTQRRTAAASKNKAASESAKATRE